MPKDEIQNLRNFSASTPKQKNLCLFFGRAGGYFIDNVKYFYIYCVQNRPEMACLFVSFDRKEADKLKQQNLPALWVNDPDALALLAKASIVVSDDFSWKTNEQLWALLSEAVSIQLWHGIPLKAIGFPEIQSTVNMTPDKAEHLTFAYSGYNSVISTSPFFTEHAFARAFKADEFVESGYPRNDVLLRRPGKYDMINADSELYMTMVKFRKNGGKVIFFMPTFRDTGGGPFEDGAIDLARLSRFCQQNGILFICKFHPYLSIANVEMPPNIVLMDPKSDAYPLLNLCDVLLTDYSSIYFDFLLLDRPIIFYAYDLDDYISKNRELLFDFEEMTPGKTVKNENDLFTAFDTIVLKGEDAYSERRNKLKKLSFTYQDGKSSERLAKHIMEKYF